MQEGRIFVVGGMARRDQKRWIDDRVLSLRPGGSWEVVATLPQPLSSPVATIIEGRLFVGGGSPNGATPQPAMWVRPIP